jgi:indole-3-glycerol phosphate synthase
MNTTPAKDAGILHRILTRKHLEVKRQKEAVSLQTLLAIGHERMERPTRSMRKALEQSPSGLIAEFKRKSPSKGWLSPSAQVTDLIPAYEHAGATACSILTDGDDFGGSLRDLQTARRLTTLPLLRKDFIIDEYQLYQSRVIGADAILLIAAALSTDDCATLAATARKLGLEVLLEIHNEEELQYLNPHIDMLGVNNRSLDTFQTNIDASLHLARHLAETLPEKNRPLTLSESGISRPEEVNRLRRAGYRGFLIGETWMRSPQPGQTLEQFIGGLQP